MARGYPFDFHIDKSHAMRQGQPGYQNAAVREPQTARAAMKQELLDVYSLRGDVKKSNCVRQTIDVDAYIGYVAPNPISFSLPSWALLINVGKTLALVSRQLCPKCDKGVATSYRAILRATQTLLRFAHGIVLSERPGNLARPLSLVVKSRYGRLFRDIPSPQRPHYALSKQITALRACLISNGSVIVYAQERKKAHEGIRYVNEAAHALEIEGPQTVCLSCKVQFENIKKLCQHFRTHHMAQKSCSVHEDCLKLSELLDDKPSVGFTESERPLSI